MRATGHLLGVVVLLAGWAALVWLAIDAGRGSSWPLAAGAGVGAAVCLFVALLLTRRFRAVRRGELAPRRTPSHRR